ncbi:hypothetical protein L6452_14099 [Arctium lappa]|uniref:Uncharacterized protein n=1 Tax=Arctium lappa TaxID=4217 RepID=A0ACB9CK43_ARCLA|nr:hypothetical protein L6452_14099 [Arctium lappa]
MEANLAGLVFCPNSATCNTRRFSFVTGSIDLVQIEVICSEHDRAEAQCDSCHLISKPIKIRPAPMASKSTMLTLQQPSSIDHFPNLQMQS